MDVRHLSQIFFIKIPETQKHKPAVFPRLAPYVKHSRLNDDAAQITVEDDPAVCRGTDVPEKIQDACSHLRAEPLVKVLFRHYGQQPFATLAFQVEALADVHGVGDAVLLVLEIQRLQEGLDVSG